MKPAAAPRSGRRRAPNRPGQPLHEAVAALRASANQFDPDSANRKKGLLATVAAHALGDPGALLAYHDCLLFLLAYPETPSLHAIALRELRRVANAARTIVETGPARARARLANSGVAWAPMTIAFGFDIARWLAEQHPRHAEIDSFDPAGETAANVLRHALPPMEFELLSALDDSEEFLAEATAGHRGTRLTWLVAQIERLPCGEGIREQLFDSLRAFITIHPAGTGLSRTFVRGLPLRTFFHREPLQRSVDPQAMLSQSLGRPRALSPADRTHLLDAGRAMLASLGRETDAVSAAATEGIEYHELGRGVAIALYVMAPGRRLPLDSHVGFVLFKNSLPVGYGGGWPFLGTAKIGVNIFAPYRGGESAYLFCQVLRVYAQRFGIGHFVAEPSQYGGGNREGLESGAFWFYYRLGFRPVVPGIAALAAHEFARMGREPRYRPPLAVLKRFTRSDIELDTLAGPTLPPCDPADLSLAVSAWIAQRFHGDRNAAQAFAERNVARALGVHGIARWPPAERDAFRSFCLLLALIPDLSRWPARDKRRVIALARAKGADEFQYFDLLRARVPGQDRLHAALRAIAAPRA